jgi:hypothetical protein
LAHCGAAGREAQADAADGVLKPPEEERIRVNDGKIHGRR